jgi:putative transcriptional regulator
MSKKTYDGIAQGIREAITHAKTGKGAVRITAKRTAAPEELKTARKKVGLTRAAFASAFGLSPATLRKWENGERVPTGAAKALLTIIAREPIATLRAMGVK